MLYQQKLIQDEKVVRHPHFHFIIGAHEKALHEVFGGVQSPANIVIGCGYDVLFGVFEILGETHDNYDTMSISTQSFMPLPIAR